MTPQQIQDELVALREIEKLRSQGTLKVKQGMYGGLPLFNIHCNFTFKNCPKTRRARIGTCALSQNANYFAAAPRMMQLIEAQAAEIERLKNSNNCRACNGNSWGD